MVHIALPFGLIIDLGKLVDLVLGVIPAELGIAVTAAFDLSPIFDATLDSSWLFDTWNQLVLLYAQSF
jgi:hypothetical protein